MSLSVATHTLHLWEPLELDARGEKGTVDVHEVEPGWEDPRDYRLPAQRREEGETCSDRLADRRYVEECAPLKITLRDSIQCSVSLASCSNAE